MSSNTSILYNNLIEKYKENPNAIMDEYNMKYRNKERLIRYGSITLGILSMLIIFIGIYSMNWVWKTVDSRLLSILIILIILIISTALTYRLVRVADSASKFTELTSIKKTYETAYIDTLYPNHIDRKNNTEGLRSKWILKRCFSKWKLFNNPN